MVTRAITGWSTTVAACVLVSACAAGAQLSLPPLSVAEKADILSAVLLARVEILADSSPVGSCGIYAALGNRADYVTMLDPRVRSRIEVRSPEPCSPHPVEADTSLNRAEKRRRFRAERPSFVTVRSIERDGERAVVSLEVTRPGAGYNEIHRVWALSAVQPGAPQWQVRAVSIQGLIVF